MRRASLIVRAASALAGPRAMHFHSAQAAPIRRRPAGILIAGAIGVCSGGVVLCKTGGKLHAEADELFERNDYEALVKFLRDGMAATPDDSQLLWRLSRALKKQADADTKNRKTLLHESLELAKRAVELEPNCGNAHKWCGIALSSSSSFEGTTASIKNSFVVADHFKRAVDLNPKDATARHLLGLWCYEVAKLSWLEQKVAATLFAAPPTATFEEAYEHFVAAEKIDPGFYPKNMLLLAQTCARLGLKQEATHWHSRCLASKARTPEDEETLAEAAKLKL